VEASAREKERERKKKKKPFQDMSLPHLVFLFPTPPISALLANRSVTTQAPSSNGNSSSNTTNNNNTNGKRNPITQSQEKIAAFNIK
jgi:hypothetical protein